MKKILLLFLIIITAGVFYFYNSQNVDTPLNEEKISEQQDNVAQIEIKNEETKPVPTQTRSYIIPDTGQVSCYDKSKSINCPKSSGSYFGQDAQYTTNTPSYKDNGDGTITDLNTGLMWIKSAGEKQAYYPAIKNAENFSFAGYDDWRVPTIKELYSLMDFRGIDPDSQGTDSSGLTPFIDTKYFDFKYGDLSSGDRIIDSQWITTSVYVASVMSGQECFFGVNFADGRIKCYPTGKDSNKQKTFYLRLVRGNTDYGINNFKNKGDGTVSDLATGLVWQQKDNREGVSWGDALNYCENLNLAGKSDWRLPDIKELQSIVDYTRSPSTTNSPALNPVFSATQITNEAGQKDWGYYWSATTHKSFVSASPAAYISFGRALGYMSEFGGWVDVHGAGAQRSDDKEGNPDDYPTGHGPQGDAKRFYNFVRCVRGGAEFNTNTVLDNSVSQTQEVVPKTSLVSTKKPPQEAMDVCRNKEEGSQCSFNTPQGNISGYCKTTPDNLFVCVP